MVLGFGKKYSEQQLIIDCKVHNKKAQQQIYEMLAPYMKGICMRYVLDIAAAEDIMQEGFIKVFANIQAFEYKGDGSLRAWISRIMVNLSLDYLKKQKRITIIPVEFAWDEIEDEEDDDVNSLFEMVKRKGISKEELLVMLESLPETTRLVFNLFAIEQLKHKEIAETLGIAEEASRTRLKRARLQLKEKLAVYCNYVSKNVIV
jgi:RNA polymerase sigma-70 factor (ECF subfamily)